MSRELSIYPDLQHVQEPFDPASIEELCFPSADAKRALMQWSGRQGYSKNLLLHGPSGSGKTRAAHVLCRERLGARSDDWQPIDYVECESGTFDALFQRLKSTQHTFQKLTDPDFEQFVILDEFDNFKSTQQVQLKKILERTDLTFVLLTNHVAKIDPGIRNRCLEILWHIPAPDACLPRLRQVADAVGAGHVADATLAERVYTSAGWRQMLRNLDQMKSMP